MASDRRTRATRARAEEALVRFAILAGSHSEDFIVIGGLNPDFLARGAPAPHQGTTDVDLLFALGFDQEDANLDFSWLDGALVAGGFTSTNSWRWDAKLGDAYVRLEFLCDILDSTADTVPLPGSSVAVALKLAGPAAALINPIQRELKVSTKVQSDFPHAPDTVTLRFANLGGYLLAKAAAAKSRMLTKDKYDLMYVVLYCDRGGATAAAEAVVQQLSLVREIATSDDIIWAMRQFLDQSGSWAREFANEMVATGDSASEEQLRNDAAVGARRFLEAMGQGE